MRQQPGDSSLVSYFVASFLPEPSALRLARLAARLPDPIEPHAPGRLHLTWRSFDGLPPGALAPLKAALSGVVERHGPVTLEIVGGGVFAAGAVWARVLPAAPVMALQADIDAALRGLGLPPASYPFVPHVTIGVGPTGTRLPSYLLDLSTRIVLGELVLSTTGTQPYRVVKHFPLGS